jgi:L-amino acid N-acyltransferase YncA
VHARLSVSRDQKAALELIGAYYGSVKYARAVLERWPRSWALVLSVDGRAVAAEVFYAVRLAVTACVHYYAVVAPEHRGHGLGRLLVTLAERECGAGIYLATTREDNTPAMRLFEGLGYRPYRWEGLPRAARDALLRATCGYDDDILYVKGGDPRVIAAVTGEVARLWRETCLKPYLGA